MIFIFPTFPYTKQIDDEYSKEYQFCQDNNINVILVDFESKKIISKNYDKKEMAIYRGWMLSNEDYQWLSNNFNLDTKMEDYLLLQDIRKWYPILKDMTFETEIFENIQDFNTNFNQKHDKYILKNYTKSLGVVSSKEEVNEILSKNIQNNFEGIVLRKFEELKPYEYRFFIYKQKPICLYKYMPYIVKQAIDTLNNDKLYTIDIVETINKELKIVEIGDGQVCAFKNDNTNIYMHQFFKLMVYAHNEMIKNKQKELNMDYFEMEEEASTLGLYTFETITTD